MSAPFLICANCGSRIEEEHWGWLHVATAERECWGFPHYGTQVARPKSPERPPTTLVPQRVVIIGRAVRPPSEGTDG